MSYYKEATAKAHLIIQMYLNDAIANPRCRGGYQAIQCLKNCVDDAYSQILGGEGFELDFDPDLLERDED
jgi:hypothetical protein